MTDRHRFYRRHSTTRRDRQCQLTTCLTLVCIIHLFHLVDYQNFKVCLVQFSVFAARQDSMLGRCSVLAVAEASVCLSVCLFAHHLYENDAS